MRHLCTVAMMTLMLAGAITAADHSRSAAPAEQLTLLRETLGVDAFAAENPNVPGRFIAALFFPTQLLVISAPYSAPTLLRERIAAREYRQVYTDLSTAGGRTDRIFVQDMGVPGLSATRKAGEPFDMTWRDVTNGIHYDGDPAAQKLSQPAYRTRFESDDAAYAELLEILIAAITSTAGAAAELAQP